MDFIKDITVTKKADSTIELIGEVPFSELSKHRSKALDHLGKGVKIDGFRQGHVPEDKLVQHLGEMSVLNEMATLALSQIYPEVIKTNKLSVIGPPQISITKLAKDNPLGFSATVAVFPEVELPDYKAIAAEINKDKELSGEVTEVEVDKQIEDIMRQKLAYERIQKKAVAKQAAEKSSDFSGSTELPTPESEAAKAETGAGPDELPELTDAYVKSLGEGQQFSSASEFKKFIREQLEKEKEQTAIQKQKVRITDEIIEKTTIELPQILIDSEINQMFGQLKEDLSRANLKLADYLSHLKKTESELKQEWREPAEKRAKLQLILNEIATTEKIEPDPTLLEERTNQILEQHPEANRDSVNIYVTSVLKNERVMEILEKQ